MKQNRLNAVKYAAVSRIFMFFMQVGFTMLGNAYDSSTFKQSILSHKYQSLKPDELIFSNDSKVDNIIQSSFQGYAKWDAVYFLSIASYGYEYEQMLAFFPLFPSVLSLMKGFLAVISFSVLSDLSLMIIAGVIINTVSFSIAALFLHKLTLLLSNDMKLADVTIVLFCLNPANVFNTVFYSESIYALFQFMGMYVSSQSNQQNWKYILAGLLFAAGSAARSNGLISAGYLVYSFLVEILQFLRDCKGNYKTMNNLIQIATKTIFFTTGMILVLLPFVCFQYFAYNTYCVEDLHTKEEHHWCHKTLPNSYSYIQSHYWNVGPFRYFEPKQIPNFVLAFPSILLSYAAIGSFFKTAYKGRWQFLWNILKERSQNGKFSTGSSLMENPRLLPFVFHLSFLVTFGAINIHVQVLTRMLFSSSPVLFWYCTDQFCHSKDEHKSAGMKQFLILGYFLSYTLLGCLLHCNFYPWT